MSIRDDLAQSRQNLTAMRKEKRFDMVDLICDELAIQLIDGDTIREVAIPVLAAFIAVVDDDNGKGAAERREALANKSLDAAMAKHQPETAPVAPTTAVSDAVVSESEEGETGLEVVEPEDKAEESPRRGRRAA